MSNLRILIAHPTGNQNVRNAARALAEREMLAEFWTTIAWNDHSRWNRLLPAGLQALLARRAYPDLPLQRIRCVPSRELLRLAAGLGPFARFFTSAERPCSIVGVYRHFDRAVARRLAQLRPRAVYAYEGGALQTFREARRLGILTLYEQPSCYWYWVRDLLRQEAERNPEYASLLPNLVDSQQHLEWKDRELALADHVIVASRHVRGTLAPAVPDRKIRVVPYGSPPVRPRQLSSADRSRPLRVLFVGQLVQHKGIGYLLDAVAQLGSQVELTLVGKRFRPHPRVDEACRRWRWFPTLPHNDVMNLMMQSDVLALPSLGEGFGLVVTEALACGLPVIVTPSVGAGDLIRDGREGFVVPVCSASAIAERLLGLHRDRELLASMSLHAQAAAARYSWDRYRSLFADTLGALIA